MTRLTKFNDVTFNTPKVQTKTICGVPCTIHRIPATEAPEVIGYLLADIGEIAGRLFSGESGKDTEPKKGLVNEDGTEVEDDINLLSKAASAMTDFRSLIGSAGMVGLCSQIRSKDCIDIRWYLEKLLVGKMFVSAVKVESLEDLDTLGADIPTLWELVQYAAEVNFAPFFEDPSTEDGSTASEEEDPVPDPPKDPIRMSSNLNGGMPTAGQ